MTINFELLSTILVLSNVCSSLPIIPIITAFAGSAGSNLLNVQVDTLGITKWITESSKIKKNRSGFVKDLMYTAFYKSDQKYNVLVFNLNEEHVQKLEGIQFYGSTEYSDGIKFGIWVFESGVFENKGARGWNNWAMIGSFRKNESGSVITFNKRVYHKNKITSRLTANNIFSDIKD